MKINYDITETRGSISGTQTTLYLCPGADTKDGIPEVYLWSNVGSGCPEPAYNRRWISLGSPGTAYVADALIAKLRGVEDHLLTIDAAYIGTEWDGHNHVGRWEDAIDGNLQAVRDAIADVQTYWDADDWFSPINASQLNLELASITEIAEAEIASAAGDAALDLDDCRKAIRRMIQRAAEEETDEDNAELLATYARLLATE